MTGLSSSTTAWMEDKGNLKASPWAPACRSTTTIMKNNGNLKASPWAPACRSIVANSEYKGKVAYPPLCRQRHPCISLIHELTMSNNQESAPNMIQSQVKLQVLKDLTYPVMSSVTSLIGCASKLPSEPLLATAGVQANNIPTKSRPIAAITPENFAAIVSIAKLEWNWFDLSELSFAEGDPGLYTFDATSGYGFRYMLTHMVSHELLVVLCKTRNKKADTSQKLIEKLILFRSWLKSWFKRRLWIHIFVAFLKLYDLITSNADSIEYNNIWLTYRIHIR